MTQNPATAPDSDNHIDVVFDGPPGHDAGRFVEVEDSEGRSVNIGRWIDRGDGMWALRITVTDAARAGELRPDDLVQIIPSEEVGAFAGLIGIVRSEEDEPAAPAGDGVVVAFMFPAGVASARMVMRWSTSQIARVGRALVAPDGDPRVVIDGTVNLSDGTVTEDRQVAAALERQRQLASAGDSVGAWTDKPVGIEDDAPPSPTGYGRGRRSLEYRRDTAPVEVCPTCSGPTHATESDDTGRCWSCRLEVGTRVYHRRRDMFGTVTALEADGLNVMVKYEWPLDPAAEAQRAPRAELSDAAGVTLQ